jgi:protein-S-isoprenylcysteine O-methyltransferase Ste14
MQPNRIISGTPLFAQRPDTVFEWALAGAGAATLIVFAVALQNFFVQPPTLTRGQRFFQDLSVVLGVTHGLALLVLNSAGDLWAGIGIAMYSTALALFLWSIETARRIPMTRTFVYEPQCQTVLTAGPYRWLRHPIYLSYSLAWLAAPVATHNGVLAVSAVVMMTCYVISAREEERLLAAGPRGVEYRAWQAKTWRFVPFLY